MALAPATEGTGEVIGLTCAGDSQERVEKVAEVQKLERRGRKKEKKREKLRKASGWRAKLVSCFVCGAANQDEAQEQEREHGRTRQESEKQSQKDELGSCASMEDNKRNKREKKQIGEENAQTSGITQPMAAIMTEEESLRGRKESRRACMQRFLKQVKIDRRANKKTRRSRKLVEVNKEWSTLPMKTDDAVKKVSFREEHLCDVWFFQKEPVPSQRCLSWKRALEQIRQCEMEKKMRLREREENQLVNLSSSKVLLAFSMALVVFLWFCSLKTRGLQQIHH